MCMTWQPTFKTWCENYKIKELDNSMITEYFNTSFEQLIEPLDQSKTKNKKP